MIRYISIIVFLVFYCNAFSQITANGNTGSETTAYTNGTPNDQIYIWCAENLTTYEGSLTANSPSGSGPFTFNWFYNDENTSSWVSLTSEVGMSSTLNNLPSDGYRVEIYDDMGGLIDCYVTWVWNLSSDVDVTQSIQDCDATNLTGSISSGSSFVYYNPPAPTSSITSATEIMVCFDATHTYVSDLAFYLVGPASCGSPTILLSPNPGAIGQDNICNSGNNVSNLCFTTQPSANLDVCANAPSSLSGTYSSYGPSSTSIDWSALYGCNAAQADWAVQIYDCIGADVGALTQASLTFNNLQTSCGAPTDIAYSSGAINSTINDNSCTPQTASIFQVSEQSAPITINATNTYTWSASNPSVVFTDPTSSLTQQLTDLPAGITTFYLTAGVSYNGINCTSSVDSVMFENQCCEAFADAGMQDTVICPSTDLQLGTPALPNMTYQWSPSTGLNNTTIAQPILNIDNQTGNITSNMYTVTVTDVINDCFVSDSVQVFVINRPSIFSDGTGCYYNYFVNGTNSFDVGTWSAVDTAIHFDPSANMKNPLIYTSTPGTYTVTYTDDACNNSVTAEIYYPDYPWTHLPDTTICQGSVLDLTAPNENVDQTEYVWSHGPVGTHVELSQPGVYEVTLSNVCHSSSTSFNLGVKNCFLDAPNVISLASGSPNSVWYPNAEGIKDYEIVITNRWGNVVFKCDDEVDLCDWNGKNMGGSFVEEGTYFYLINAKTEGNEEVQKQGFIQVVK